MSKVRAEYIWIDGQTPTAKMRSKTKILDLKNFDALNITYFINEPTALPDWRFDGSSTEQADQEFSDCKLKPVKVIRDPIRGGDNILVLCEVFNFQTNEPHETNTRAHLRRVVEELGDCEPQFGVEQEYTMHDEEGDNVLGWPKSTAYPEPQGRYYCGIGSDEVVGRKLVEKHTEALLKAGLDIAGTNAEVMLGQWEYQIGRVSALDGADQLWLSRWILYRLGEKMNITIKLDPKPVEGDWNGAGAHINFSTAEMRKVDGLEAIIQACKRLANHHQEHIKVYGAKNHERLTGKHETCPIDEFKWGKADRRVSVRIPAPVAKKNRGYLEDRRPAANMDPYQAFSALIKTIAGNGFDADPFEYFWKNERFWRML